MPAMGKRVIRDNRGFTATGNVLTVDNMSYLRVMVIHRSAFSLIELLVVISIITVLAGMLLPAVKVVKQVADQVRCGGNMRQAGSFLLQYCGENDGRFPGGGHDGNGSISWNSIINKELLVDEGVNFPRYGSTQTGEIGCPTFRPDSGFNRGWALNDTACNTTNGYAFIPPATRSAAYASWNSYHLGALVDRFTKKPVKVLLMDVDQGGDTGYGISNFTYRHRGTGYTNALFVDGHVQGLPRPTTSTQAQFPL